MPGAWSLKPRAAFAVVPKVKDGTQLRRMLLKSWDSKVWGRGDLDSQGPLGSAAHSVLREGKGGGGGQQNWLLSKNQCGGVGLEPHCPGARAESAEAGSGLAALRPKLQGTWALKWPLPVPLA